MQPTKVCPREGCKGAGTQEMKPEIENEGGGLRCQSKKWVCKMERKTRRQPSLFQAKPPGKESRPMVSCGKTTREIDGALINKTMQR